MGIENKTEASQFGIDALLYLTAVTGAFFALASWVIQSDSLGTLEDVPVLVAPSINAIAFGIFAVPAICAILVLLILALVLQSRPRPFTVTMFLGFVAMAICMDSNWYENSPRILFAMTLSAFIFVAESLYRNLPKPQIAAATISVCVCLGYYLFLVLVKIVATV